MNDARILSAGESWDNRLRRAAGSGESHQMGETPSSELDAWERAVDPDRLGNLAKRLEWCGLGPAAVTQLFRPSARHFDGWSRDELSAIQRSCRRAAEHLSDDHEWLARLQTVADDSLNWSTIPFFHVLSPIADYAGDRLCNTISSEVLEALSDDARSAARSVLLARLSSLLNVPLGDQFAGKRSMVDVVRRRLSELDRRRGTEPSQRGYAEFCRYQLRRGLDPLLTAYPVLGRLLVLCTRQWTEAFAEVFHRVHADRATLQLEMGVPATHVLSGVQTDLSDPHKGGRTVCILTFSTDRRSDSLKLVYKPRDLGMEAHYQDIVAFVGALVEDDTWRALKVIRRADSTPADDVLSDSRHYGYVEYVAHKPCSTEADEHSFYFNAGRLLALLHLLGASDCHYDNVVADGVQPHLVDGETLLEGSIASFVDAARPTSADGPLATSALRVGMLPSWTLLGRAQTAVDVSALGVDVGAGPRQTAAWCFVNTDDMVRGTRNLNPTAFACLPVLGTDTRIGVEHTRLLQDGFKEVYALFMSRGVRERLATLIGRFEGTTRRIIMRSTRVYSLVQGDAMSLEALADPNQRAWALEHLARAFLLFERKPSSWPILEAEIRMMESLDVPYFKSAVGSRDLILDDGVAIPDFFLLDGLREALSRLQNLSDADCEWQLRVIDGALRARDRGSGVAEPSGIARGRGGACQADAEINGVGEAEGLVESLMNWIVLDDDGAPTWLATTPFPGTDRMRISLMGPGLYDGRCGVAAFLSAAAERLDGADAVARVAERVLESVFSVFDGTDKQTRFRAAKGLGLGLTGVGGLLRALDFLSLIHAEPNWRARALNLASSVPPEMILEDTHRDVLGGGPGLILALTSLHEHAPDERFLDLTQRCACALAFNQDSETGAWLTPLGARPLTGWSHGASGAAAAMARAAEATGNERFLDCALRALAYEQRCYSISEGNWPDFRDSRSSRPGYVNAWCHGAPGVALSRMVMLETFPDHANSASWRDELNLAAGTAMQPVTVGPDHLCCGTLGRAAVLLLLAKRFQQPAWRDAGLALTTAVLARARDRGRFHLSASGANSDFSPGLMQGSAGIGMHMLHLDDATWVKCLLV